jgi:hypothetical protein
MDWAPVNLPPQAEAKLRRLTEYFLDLMLLHPEDWQRYGDGSCPVMTNERDDDGNIVVRWSGEQYATMPAALLEGDGSD